MKAPEHPPMPDHIAILDFGSQYTHLIARRVRELGVQSKIYPANTSANALQGRVWGVILSGGPRSVVREPIIPHDAGIFLLDVPILGLCYGLQLMTQHFGGTVASGEAREYGQAILDPLLQHKILRGVPRDSTVWMSHGDHVSTAPPDFVVIGQSTDGTICAIAHETKPIVGFQYHPEVTHSEFGYTMIKNFVFGVCNADINWSTAQTLDHVLREIRQQAAGKNIFCLLSGGVDSTVCYALLKRAQITGQIKAIHIDHGYMRKGESTEVVNALATIGCPVDLIDAKGQYATALAGKTDPEEKRKIIGELFIAVSKQYMQQHGLTDGSWLLCQGTIYPDTIESGDTEHADVIKTHHNRVESVRDMIAQGLIIEPIKELYKDEVRNIGKILGLPYHLVNRHPFPGPGLAIRCLCAESSEEQARLLPDERHSIYALPVKSVGVQGDERSYAHPALVTDVQLEDEGLAELSVRLTNAHKDINRVLTLLDGDVGKLGESRVKHATLSQERIALLQQADAIVRHHTENLANIWQLPVVLVPFGYSHRESLVLRPVESSEAMTVSWSIIEKPVRDALIADLLTLPIDYLFYDVTNKPPGTIEWE